MARIRFLHIAKTGGTALNLYVQAYGKKHRASDVKKHRHATTLEEACGKDPNALIAFFIREPASRFASSFYSRMREGLPSHYRARTRRETKAFKRFKTPNDLAEALSSRNPFTRLAAMLAMRGIGHVRKGYDGFLGSPACLEKYKDRIGFIGAQESYEADFEKMIAILGLDPDIPLEKDDRNSHRAPGGEDRRISEKGRANLRKWHKQDEAIYQWCLEHRREIFKRHGRQ